MHVMHETTSHKSLWYATLFSVLFILLSSAQALAQTEQKSQPKAAGAPALPVSQQLPEAEAERRRMAVQRAEAFAQKILGFRDVEIKVLATARMADLLWKDDEGYARRLFTKALDLTNAGATSDEEAGHLASLRRQVIAILSRRDAKLARSLMDADKETDSAQRMEANFSIAYDAVRKEPQKAVEFAERSLNDGVFPYMVSLLMELRRKDVRAANALFLKTLDRLVAQPTVDANQLLYLGTYVFTSPKIDPNDKTISPNAVAQVGVGSFLLYDITADRPDVPVALVVAYLKAATKILTRNIYDSRERQVYYAASYLLLPKLQKYAPDLIAPLSASMSALAPGIPQEMTETSAYANFKNEPQKDLDARLKEIESITDERMRNGRYLFLTFTLWQSKDFAHARLVADKITDLVAARQLQTLISFGEAAVSLEQNKNQLLEVEAAAEKLPQDIERALLWLGIARAYADQGNAARAREAIEKALTAAEHIEDGRKPLLTLSAASLLARVSEARASSTLGQAVRQFNAQKPASLREVSWRRRIETGSTRLDFPLKVKGVDLGFSRSLPPLFTADLESTLAAVNELTAEDLQAQAWLVITAMTLK